MAIVLEAKISQVHRKGSETIVVSRFFICDGPYTGTLGKETYQYYKRVPVGEKIYTQVFSDKAVSADVAAAITTKLSEENAKLALGFKTNELLCKVSPGI